MSANIGPRQRRRRYLLAFNGLLAGFGLAAFLLAGDFPPAARLLLFLPFWGGLLGFFQAREKT